MYHYRHNTGDRVTVNATTGQGDAYHNGRNGTVAGHELNRDDDREWPEVLVRWDDSKQDAPSRVLDYNLTHTER